MRTWSLSTSSWALAALIAVAGCDSPGGGGDTDQSYLFQANW